MRMEKARRLPLAATLIACSLFLPASHVHAQTTQRVSVSSAPPGEEGDGLSFLPAISADGRFVAFSSAASNLVPDDTNNASDVFVHDLQTAQTTRVSVSSTPAGAQSNDFSAAPAISGDGRFVAFSSIATNLVPDDSNGFNDVFVHDRETGQTTLISVSSSGAQGNGNSHTPAISANGRFVAFESDATALVPGDTNTLWDIFIHDRETGETTRVSIASSGAQSNGDSRWASISADGRHLSFTSGASTLVPGSPGGGGPIPPPTQVYVRDRQANTTIAASLSSNGAFGADNSLGSAISGDGRFVAFSSFAGNLSSDDNTASEDVFVRDLQEATTALVSVSSAGVQANSWSFWPRISADGRIIAFVSDASNLSRDDTNARRDVFVHDRLTEETSRVSVSSRAEQGNDNSGFFSGPALSADGRFVAFESFASNLVPGDANSTNDAFVHDRSAPPPPPCAAADVNCDGAVDVDDLVAVILGWGACAECDPANCPADIVDDCDVDVDDLVAVILNWG